MDAEQPTTGKRPGRPAKPGGPTKKRNVRVGDVWDDGEKLAAACGITMTAYVIEALKRENTRVRRQLKTEGTADPTAARAA